MQIYSTNTYAHIIANHICRHSRVTNIYANIFHQQFGAQVFQIQIYK